MMLFSLLAGTVHDVSHTGMTNDSKCHRDSINALFMLQIFPVADHPVVGEFASSQADKGIHTFWRGNVHEQSLSVQVF